MLWFFLSLLLTAPPQTTYFSSLENQYRQGVITEQQLFNYREWAVKAPHKLPLKYRKLLDERPLTEKSLTSVLVDNFQLSRIKGLKANYSFPAELDHYVDSAIYPLRVYYKDPSMESKAISLLSYAESAWEIEIDEWGFYAPPVVTPEGRYRIYIDDASGAAGYTAPVDEYPDTPWDDCVTYIVIEQDMHNWGMFDTMAHELNHASQAAMDCMEPTAFWENTAVFSEIAISSQGMYMAAYYSEAFQLQPFKGLSGGTTGDLFWYGGYLWPLFISDHLGSGPQDAVYIRQIWENSMQESGFSLNSPSYLEAIDEMAQEQGSSLNNVFTDFSRARWFVDNKASSLYSTMPYADQIYPIPRVTQTISLSTETQTFTPAEDQQPQRYATNYILLDKPSDYSFPTKITVVESGTDPWAIQLFSASNGALESIFDDDSDGSLSITYDPELYKDAVLVIQHLADDGFNPSNLPTGETYTVQVRPAIDLPLIT
ncbi:hypothetical protein KKF84_05810, partial [Myxococcota bacterium]|nr:hypothetical protein [Myxococcota bacterium]MBU1534814.1 hypothetical protein [Myxococcota bacterium]